MRVFSLNNVILIPSVMMLDGNCCCYETHTDTNFLTYLDVNECATNNGGCDSKRACKNTVGSMSCGACPAGYDADGAKGCKGLCVFVYVCMYVCMCVCMCVFARMSGELMYGGCLGMPNRLSAFQLERQ